MTALILLGLIGGLITGVSPCVLPMLPIIFFAAAAGTDQGNPRSARTNQGTMAPAAPTWVPVGARPLKIIAGLVLSFAVFTLAGTLILSALHLPDSLLRWAGVTILALVGVGLIVPRLEQLVQRPFWRLPKVRGKLTGSPFVFGIGLGTLYVPCAGPVLAAVTLAGATGHVGGGVIALTLAFSVGAALPLLVFASAGQRIRDRLSAYRRRARLLDVIGGLTMVGLAVALALGATDTLQRGVPDYTQQLQAVLEGSASARHQLSGLGEPGVDTAGPLFTANGPSPKPAAHPSSTSSATSPSTISHPRLSAAPSRPSQTPADARHASPTPSTTRATASATAPQYPQSPCEEGAPFLARCGPAPAITGISHWLNTPRDQAVDLPAERGRVVLVDFWAYSCINCQRAIPHVQAWYSTYHRAGLDVIGVHTPEFAFEHSTGNVASAIASLGITYPVAQDNAYSTWGSYHNRYWPAEYLIDASGNVRHFSFGEGGYQQTESQIRQLLVQARPGVHLPAPTDLPDHDLVFGPQSPETYFGAARSTSYAGTGTLRDGAAGYFGLNQRQLPTTYSLGGQWGITSQYLHAYAGSSLRLAYTAKDVYLVLGGSGLVTISTLGGPDRTILVTGAPTLHQILAHAASTSGVVTLMANGPVDFYTATFG